MIETFLVKMENWKESPHSYGTHMNPSGNQPLYQYYNQGGQYRVALLPQPPHYATPAQYQHQSYQEPNRHLAPSGQPPQPHLVFYQPGTPQSSHPYQNAVQGFSSYQHGQSHSEVYPHQNQGFGSFQNAQRLQNPNPYQTDNQQGFVVPSEQSLPGYSYDDQSLGSFEQQSQNPIPSHSDDHKFRSSKHKQTMEGVQKEKKQRWIPPQVKKESVMPGSSTDVHEVGKAQIKETGRASGLESGLNETGEVPTTTTAEASVTPTIYCVPPSSGLRVRINRNKALSDYIIIEYLKQFGKCSIARASKNNNRARIVTFESQNEGQAAVDAGQQNQTGRKRYAVHNIQGKDVALVHFIQLAEEQPMSRSKEDKQAEHEQYQKMYKNLNDHACLQLKGVTNVPDAPIIAHFGAFCNGPCQLLRLCKGHMKGRLYFLTAEGAEAAMSAGKVETTSKGVEISRHFIFVGKDGGRKRHSCVVRYIRKHRDRAGCKCKWNRKGSVQPRPPGVHDEDDDDDDGEEYDQDDDKDIENEDQQYVCN